VFRQDNLLKNNVISSIISTKNTILIKTMSRSLTTTKPPSSFFDIKNKEKLKEKLTPIQYHVTQEKGTEYAYSGEYDKFFQEGVYDCIVCGGKLFKSDSKFDSGCGWPAFSEADKDSVTTIKDLSHGMERIEVNCKCGSHLGHVFDDGPKDKGGKRFCINSASLKFNKKYIFGRKDIFGCFTNIKNYLRIA